MCTALARGGFFGRTLDLECSYDEQVVVLPRNAPLPFRLWDDLPRHHAFVGMAHAADGQPLFYDGVNEHGLAMAALNFPHSAAYLPKHPHKINLAPFELMGRVLGQCATAAQAESLLRQVHVTALDFAPSLPSTPLHWLIADERDAFVAEPRADGLHLYPDPVGVLANEPPFPMQLSRLNDYRHLSASPTENHFAPHLPLPAYSRGMGALGLPGDWSSPSRFVRAAFAAHNAPAPLTVPDFFRLMACVQVPPGCVRLEDGSTVLSRYTSCCHLRSGVYHYVTCENPRICAVDLHQCDLEGDAPLFFPLVSGPQIFVQNKKDRGAARPDPFNPPAWS